MQVKAETETGSSGALPFLPTPVHYRAAGPASNSPDHPTLNKKIGSGFGWKQGPDSAHNDSGPAW